MSHFNMTFYLRVSFGDLLGPNVDPVAVPKRPTNSIWALLGALAAPTRRTCRLQEVPGFFLPEMLFIFGTVLTKQSSEGLAEITNSV
jgi:hypothetical protein